MNETRGKPATGTWCPTLFDKWQRIFYMPSRTDTAGHTKAYIYPVMDCWGKVILLRYKADSKRRPVRPQSNHPDVHPKLEDQLPAGSSRGGGSSPYSLQNKYGDNCARIRLCRSNSKLNYRYFIDRTIELLVSNRFPMNCQAFWLWLAKYNLDRVANCDQLGPTTIFHFWDKFHSFTPE